MTTIPEYVDGLPNICGQEHLIEEAMGSAEPVATAGGFRSAFAIALHMHQPLIPAGGGDPATAAVIGNLQWMTEHPDIGDNHNARVFAWCYKRMGEYVPELIDEGTEPRVMLDYSGTLLHGLCQMGRHDVIDALRGLTTEPRATRSVEWLGSAWGHPVAPSTPVQDYRLHVRAWQHHFAALFGLDALARVHGFSPAEMALPNHPDVAHELVRTLTECGYRWVLVQEHSVEQPDGSPVRHPHLPHRLVCVNSRGATAEITAIVKTQGSDTKLVGQMQPYYEALDLAPVDDVPQLVTQIADGENGGVMMNEFPPKYFDVVRECSGTGTPMLNVSEYLAHVAHHTRLPAIQPVFQHRIWQRCAPGDGPDRLAEVVTELSGQDDRFHVDGGSWTNDMSWVHGYRNVLAPMERASAAFNEHLLVPGVPTDDPRYRRALFHLLSAQTSCYRYWGQGTWTDYGRAMAERAVAAATGQEVP